ncbi:uncharacterized protein LOC143030090 [Oratosquilla oratoria]|uniref:uncharacterized protein LOC143030090 n=1 Tax=Oratosquilla oratoria TaxID=337810 RepID=UPI003F75F11E
MAFKLVESLRKHVYTHLHKKISCHICGQCFTRSGSLVRHLKRNTWRKPFQCDYCGKRFCELKSWNKHAYIHTPGSNPGGSCQSTSTQ